MLSGLDSLERVNARQQDGAVPRSSLLGSAMSRFPSSDRIRREAETAGWGEGRAAGSGPIVPSLGDSLTVQQHIQLPG